MSESYARIVVISARHIQFEYADGVASVEYFRHFDVFVHRFSAYRREHLLFKNFFKARKFFFLNTVNAGIYGKILS